MGPKLIAGYLQSIDDGTGVNIIGGTALLREAIRSALSIQDQDESIPDLIRQLNTQVTVVIVINEDLWTELAIRASEGPHVIAVLPAPSIHDFIRAFRAGASGAVWEDTPPSHLAQVTRAALRKDALLPSPVLNVY